MNVADLVFVGFNRRVAALNRFSGEIVWQWKADKGNSYVTLLLDGEILMVSVDGYMYALEALTGLQLWFNKMAGFGSGVTSLASVNGSAQNVSAAADIIQRASAMQNTASTPASASSPTFS